MSSTKGFNILIADDHLLFGDLLESYLTSKGYTCSRAKSYDELYSKDTSRSENTFDIVLLDIMMPGFQNHKSLEAVVDKFKPCPVVALTSIPSAEYAREAMSVGLRGYLQKTMSLRKIPITIEFIISGETFVEGLPIGGDQIDQNGSLNPLEKRVLSLIARGLSNKEIALEIGNTETMVKSINRSLSRKLKVKNRTQLALLATRQPSLIGSSRTI